MIEPRQPEPFIPVTDIWQKSRLNEHRLGAYRRLIDLGEIRILKVVYEKTSGRISIQYLSNVPEEWIHQSLKSCLPPVREEQMQIDFPEMGADQPERRNVQLCIDMEGGVA